MVPGNLHWMAFQSMRLDHQPFHDSLKGQQIPMLLAAVTAMVVNERSHRQYFSHLECACRPQNLHRGQDDSDIRQWQGRVSCYFILDHEP